MAVHPLNYSTWGSLDASLITIVQIMAARVALVSATLPFLSSKKT